MRPDGSRLSENKVSDYRTRIKVSGPHVDPFFSLRLLRPFECGLIMGNQTSGLSDEDKSNGSPVLRNDGNGLSLIKLSDYQMRIKVSGSLL
jgi:hypothetical protein